MNTIIFGANSAIAKETASLLAKNSNKLILVSRNSQKLSSLKDHLQTINPKLIVETAAHDFADLQTLDSTISDLINRHSDIDLAFIAYGELGDHNLALKDHEELLKIVNTNFVSATVILQHIANYFEGKKQGTIAVITSVAGDRGRKSNYIYGAAKGGLSIFLQGLRHRLAYSNVTVIDIKPGFVDTPMTKHVPKNYLFATPQLIAKYIIRAIAKKHHTVYAPWFWKYIMLIIRLIPESIFKKTSI